MHILLIGIASIIIVCIILNKMFYKIGVPALLAFILLGLIFGSDSFIKIPFDNYDFAEKACSIGLSFIMFYGGFGSKWSEAKPVATQAILLSFMGVVMTALITGLFCHFVLRIAWMESFLIGSVISSTDAASVFYILRSKKLGLKENTASLLEMESGSNDPSSYMLMVIVLSMMQGSVNGGQMAYLIFAQIVYGILIGAAIGIFASFILKKFDFVSSGFDSIFVVAIVLFAYAAPTAINGNGYLSVYIAGIIIGNQEIKNKKALVNFFDGLNGLTQMLIFFLLGLLATPSKLPEVALIGFLIALFMTFVSRPIATFTLLAPFKGSLNQKLLVSWAGLRGAASIVFAVMAMSSNLIFDNDIFHIVFFIVLFSILFQGTLLAPAARMLKMTDSQENVMKTFTDYTEQVAVQFVKTKVSDSNPWINQQLKDITFPEDTLLIMILRNSKYIVPNGKTTLEANDILIFSAKAPTDIEGVHLYEKRVKKGSELINKKIKELQPNKTELIVMIQRGNKVIIPKGETVIKEKDLLVINECTA